MTEPLSYHVYDSRNGEWYDDEHVAWRTRFSDSTAFETIEAANIAMLAAGGDYVFACMPSA